jgi:predicted ester cyclase
MEPPMSQVNRTTAEQANVETVLKLLTLGWGGNQNWQAVWRAEMSRDVRTFFHSNPPVKGIANAIEFNALLFAGFPELKLTIVNVIAEGDYVIVQGHLKGRHSGTFLNVPATSTMIEVPDVTIFRLSSGKVLEMRYFTDLLAVMGAIGALSSG